MEQQPRVSVVVASYNYEDFVVETLGSLWAQTSRAFEIVVVDDGSTDRSVEEIRRFIAGHAQGDVPIRLLMHPDGRNHGLQATVALGVRAARGEFVAFCESDDLWTPDHLAEVLKEVDRSGGRAEVVVNDVELFGDPDRCQAFIRVHRRCREACRPGRNRISPAAFRDANVIPTFSCVLVRRTVLLACDFNPAGRASALDWWLWRQVCYDRPIWYVDRVLTRWRMHQSQMAADHADESLSERQQAFITAGSQLLRRQHPLSSRWRLVHLAPPLRVGWRKNLRKVLKQLIPYAVQRSYAARTYGIVFPDGRTWPGWIGLLQRAVVAALPFGLVCRLKGLDPDNGIGGEVPQNGAQPAYRLSRSRYRNLLRAREDGRRAYQDAIARNQSVRIAVVLHLYYDAAWKVVAEYLRNLEPYGFDLFVTATQGRISEKTLQAVRAFAPGARVLMCENRGFDLGPFVRALSEIDLDRYDVVFKLHSKGITRPFIFIYDQVFKHWDWFLALFEGVLGGRNVHACIDAIASGRAQLVAAAHLIVSDPPHKARLVQAFCRARQLPFVDNYRFVAGTCFAVHPKVLAPLKALNLAEADFAPVRRGVFSAAHALERWICFAAAGRMEGLPVEHPTYPAEAESCRARSPLRLLNDTRFVLDDDFFYRVLETRSVSRYEVVRIRLGEIRRLTNDGRLVTLAECAPYRYLQGETEGYENYCAINRAVSGFDMSVARFEELRTSLQRYDPRRMPVLRAPKNIIMDGQHRCCILLDRFGPDYEISVLRIW